MVALALAVGLAMPAAGAVDVVGRSVRFEWQPATGPLIGYMVFLTRNAGSELFVQATVASQPWVRIDGEYGDEVRIRVTAFDVAVNTGASSAYSIPVRFVATAPVVPPTGGDPDPTPDPDPAPDPTPDPDPAPDPLPELPPAALDFDGDGRSDLVVRNRDTGETSVLTMNGSNPTGGRFLSSHPPEWQLVGNGDYDGDRIADSLWLDEVAGELHVELTDPDAVAPLEQSILSLPGSYELGGSADVDGDGRSDLVVVDLDRDELQVWMMDGVVVDRIVPLGRPGGQQVVASGDFDGDGRIEIFSQNPQFRWQYMWQIENDTLVSRRSYSQNIGASWVSIGAADHDGDGVDDILWLDRNSGVMEAWCFQANGSLIRKTIGMPLPANAEASGAGDFDGDGRAEIAVREESPVRLLLWYVEDSVVVARVPVATLAPSWSLGGIGSEAPAP